MNKFDTYAWIEYYNKRNKEDLNKLQHLKKFEAINVDNFKFYLCRIQEGTKGIKRHIKKLKKAERKESKKA